ncbi:hypothetical protein BD311DRAFT_263612 [Dichomitus squalens]|uniref:Uncharacterized protein n=1 Tax=Dichomitus squalens TaxID=114155 RepID=A0A4Q9MSH7_9APHY|nr:hypothetical protein BD311DRAFT_263612 [Dichomitus squalens]
MRCPCPPMSEERRRRMGSKPRFCTMPRRPGEREATGRDVRRCAYRSGGARWPFEYAVTEGGCVDRRTWALTWPEKFGLACAGGCCCCWCAPKAGAEEGEGEAVAHDGSGGGAMDPRRLSGVELSWSGSFAFELLFPSGARASSGAVSSERACGEGGAGERASSSKSL